MPGAFTPAETAEADEWAATVTQAGDLVIRSDEGDLRAIAAAAGRRLGVDHP